MQMEGAMRTILAFLATTVAAAAGDVTFEYENFEVTQTGRAELVLKFINGTGSALDYAVARCALLDVNGRAITTLSVIATNVPNGGIAYASNFGPPDKRIRQADCRIDN
jgi:hypothetical protein